MAILSTKEKKATITDWLEGLATKLGYKLVPIEEEAKPEDKFKKWKDYKKWSISDLAVEISRVQSEVTAEKERLGKVRSEVITYLQGKDIVAEPWNQYLMTNNALSGKKVINERSLSVENGTLVELKELQGFLVNLEIDKKKEEMINRVRKAVPSLVDGKEITGVTGKQVVFTI